MTNQDYEFRVTLSHDQVWCEYEGPGVEDGEMPAVPISRDEHMETIQLLEAWLKRWEWIARTKDERLLVPDTFQVLGNHLWQMALREVPGQRLIQAIQDVRRSRSHPRPTVRVRMSFTNDAGDLAALPWEFVHLAGEQAFLAAETSLTLGRYLEGEAFHDVDFQSPDNKLRVLFVVCLPNWPEYDDERAATQQLINDLRQLGRVGGLITTPSRMQLALYQGWHHDSVRAKLAAFRDGEDGGPVDVVHLIALFKRGGEHLIQLPNDEGDWKWTTNTMQVVGALTADPDNMPKLVILHLCDWHESDSQNAPEHFEQLAPEFIRRNIPAVLAMQYPMRTGDGCDFVPSLYKKLAAGDEHRCRGPGNTQGPRVPARPLLRYPRALYADPGRRWSGETGGG